MTTDERTDKVLHAFRDKQPHHFYATCVNVFPDETDAYKFGTIHEALEKYMIEQGLITTPDHQWYRLTAKGIDMLDIHGGWLKYWVAKNAEKEQASKKEEADKKRVEGMSTRRYLITNVIALIVGFLGGNWLSLFQSIKEPLPDTAKPKRQIDSLLKVTDSLTNRLNTKDEPAEPDTTKTKP